MDQVNQNFPGRPKALRVSVYIDGFNIYFGIRDSGFGRYLWLDLSALANNLLRPGQQLASIKYFTSRISGPENKRKRQNVYLDALETLDKTKFSITYGRYQPAPFTCPECNQISQVPNEKQTDVNIAVTMLGDAFQDSFDIALLVSADSDLCPVVSTIKRLFPDKKVVVCFPPGRASKELALLTAHYTIGRKILHDSQFPRVIDVSSKLKLVKPELWDTPDYQHPH